MLRLVEHVAEAPFTALIPAQLLGLYILRVGGTISFLQQRGTGMRDGERHTHTNPQMQAALRMQLEMLLEYKKAARELTELSAHQFKSYKKRSDCKALRFVPANCLTAESRVEVGDWSSSYPTVTFAAPAATGTLLLHSRTPFTSSLGPSLCY